MTRIEPVSSTGDADDDMASAVHGLLAARAGHFLLESGHHGDLWLELDRVFSTPARIAPLASRLAELLAPHRLDVVCGPMTGGALLAQLVATRLGVTFAWADRSPGSASGSYSAVYRVPEGQRPLLRDRRVAIVDDVINAGSATRATSSEVEAEGGTIVAVGALLVLGDRAAKLASATGVPLECLASRVAPIWSPDQCPFCTAGEPLEGKVS